MSAPAAHMVGLIEKADRLRRLRAGMPADCDLPVVPSGAFWACTLCTPAACQCAEASS